MTSVINLKGVKIKKSQKRFKDLKHHIERINMKIEEKDKIIKSLEDEDQDDNSTEERGDEDDKIDNDGSKDEGLLLGSAHFGKELHVKEGMEEESKSLRKEWKRKLKLK